MNLAENNRQERETRLNKLSRLLFGQDVFVSYARNDATKYSLGLANELTNKDFSCFLDQWGTPPGKEIPEDVILTLKKSTLFVLLGTKDAASSDNVRGEIEAFLKTRRTLIPISFGGALEKASWFNLIEGLTIAKESMNALESGKPSEQVITRIANAEKFTRRNKRVRQVVWNTILAAILGLTAVGFAAYIWIRQAERRVTEANENLRRANEAAQSAENRLKAAEEGAEKALKAMGIAQQNMIQAQTDQQIAEKNALIAREKEMEARDIAREQQGIALARERANDAEDVRGTSGESLLLSTSISLQSFGQYPTFEGDKAIRNNLALLSTRRSSTEISNNARAVFISPDAAYFAIITADKHLEVRNAQGGIVMSPIAYEGELAAISSGGKYLATADRKKAYVKEISTGRQWEFTPTNGLGRFSHLAISPDGKYLSALYYYSNPYEENPCLALYMLLANIEKNYSIETDAGAFYNKGICDVASVAFSSTGDYLAFGGVKNTEGEMALGCAWSWSIDELDIGVGLHLEKLSETRLLEQDEVVKAVSCSSDSQYLATGSDKTVWVWQETNIGVYRQIARIPTNGIVGSIAFNPDNKTINIVMGGEEDTQSYGELPEPSPKVLQVWDAIGKGEALQLDHSSHLRAVTFNQYGTQVTTASQTRDGEEAIRIVDIESSDEQKERNLPLDPLGEMVDFGGNGIYLASYDEGERRFEVWNVVGKKQIGSGLGRREQQIFVAKQMDLSSDGSFIALSGKARDRDGDAILIYQVPVTPEPSGEPVVFSIKHLIPVDGEIQSLAISKGGRYVAVAKMDGAVQIWKVGQKEPITPSPIRGLRNVSSLGFSDTGALLFTIIEGEAVQVWEPTRGQSIQRFKPDGPVKMAALSPDGKYLAAARSDGATWVWEVATARRLTRVKHVGPVNVLTFSPDNRYLATGGELDEFSNAGSVTRVWQLQPKDLILEASKRLAQQNTNK